MGALTWDEVGTREYEVGVSKCVLFVKGDNGDYGDGVAWSGITAITESPDGAEANDIYADNIKYGSMRSNENFGGTIEAYTYPDEWSECDGLSSPAEGVEVGGQTRKQFGLSYRTEIGSDTSSEAGYKLHLVWGATASPSERSYETINDSPDAITFSWEFDTTPVVTAGYRPVSHMSIDSTALDEDGRLALQALEVVLYGNDGIDSMLPTPEEVITMFGGSGIVHTIITNASNAEAWATGERGGQPVEEDDPTYHNNAKYHSEQAASYYQDAGYDVDFDDETNKMYLLDQNGDRTGDGAELKLNDYAKIDGYYESLTSGQTTQLISSVFVNDKVPYNFRTSGGSADIGDREYDTIVGGSVAWNQMCDNSGTSATANNIVFTNNNDGTWSVSTINEGPPSSSTRTVSYINFNSGHKYLIKGAPEGGNGGWQLDCRDSSSAQYAGSSDIGMGAIFVVNNSDNIGTIRIRVGGGTVIPNAVIFIPQLFDLTLMFGTQIADYIYNLEQSTPGAGVAKLKQWGYFLKSYYAYNAGALPGVNVSEHQTTGLNQWDEEWEVGTLSSGVPVANANCIRSKNFCDCFSDTNYYCTCLSATSSYFILVNFYDGDKNYLSSIYTANKGFTTPANAKYFKISTQEAEVAKYGSTYNNDICINLAWDGERNGEYEPYNLRSYPLDSSLILRGIPVLDENNQLRYDGDIYNADGTVTRRYGIVDLGTLTWSGTNYFQTPLLTEFASPSWSRYISRTFITPKYTAIPWSVLDGGTPDDKTIAQLVDNGKGIFRVYDSAYSDAATFTTAMSGVYLVYELATPTTETADPFQSPQIVDDWGTERYVVTAQGDVEVPVGHDTNYANNLRAKLEMAPNSPSGNGVYVLQQINGMNVYIPLELPVDELPAAPEENGTYSLKVTVNDGTVIYSWAQ